MALFPLLGLLGLGAASYAQPMMQNRANRIRGQYAGGLLEGVDTNDPGQTRDALFGGGLLTGSEFQGDSRTGYEGVQTRDAQMARQRVASGPGYMNAQTARDRLNWERNAAEQQREQYLEQMRALGFPEGIPEGMKVTDYIAAVESGMVDPPPGMSVPQTPYNKEQIGYYNTSQQAQSALTTIDQMVEFRKSPGVLDEATNLTEQRRLEAAMQLNVQPMVMEILNTGVLQGNEQERVNRLLQERGIVGMFNPLNTDKKDLAALDSLRRAIVTRGNRASDNLNLSLGQFGPRQQPFTDTPLFPDDAPLPEPPASGTSTLVTVPDQAPQGGTPKLSPDQIMQRLEGLSQFEQDQMMRYLRAQGLLPEGM